MKQYRSISRTFALALLLSLASATTSFGQWYRDYESGVKAVSQGDFQAAVELLESARRSGPDPGDRVRYFGMRYDSFYPHYYLGKAYQGLGNAEKAREMLERSTQTGELSKSAQLAADRQSALEALASPRAADVEPTRPDLAPQLAQIRASLQRGATGEARQELAGLQKEHPADDRVRALSTEIRDAVSAAEKKLDDASGLVERGELSRARPLIDEALRVDVTRPGAEALRSKLEAAEKSAELSKSVASIRTMLGAGRISDAEQELSKARRIDPRYPHLTELAAYVEEVRRASRAYSRKEFAEAEPLLAELIRKHSDNPWARRVHDEVRKQLAEIRTADVADPAPPDRGTDVPAEGPKIDAPTGLDPVEAILDEARELLAQRRIQDAVDVVGRAELPEGAPARASIEDEIRQAAFEKARDGVRKIFRGQGEDAIAELEDAGAALRDRAMFHLYLALAYHREYLYEGQNDTELLKKMELAIRQALELDRDVQPDPRLFSPVFRSAMARLREGS